MKRLTNYGMPAGKIGNLMESLADEWGEEIPPVNLIIVAEVVRERSIRR